MASIYHFTSSVLSRHRGRVSVATTEDGAFVQQRSLSTSPISSKNTTSGPQRTGPMASLRAGKRPALAAVHRVNAQASATEHRPASSEVSEACNRLTALSLRQPTKRKRPHIAALQFVLEAAAAPPDLTPKATSYSTQPSVEQGRKQAFAGRPRTLRPTRKDRTMVSLTLFEAQESAALAMMAQKLRLGLSRAQNTGTPEALLTAIAQVEAAVTTDTHLTPSMREQVGTLLTYLGQLAAGSWSVECGEALKHIEELCPQLIS